MIFPPALILGAHPIMPVSDSVPTLNVDQVCTGIAQQGGVTFHDSDITEEKKNCLDSEQSIRNELVKQWSTFAPADKTACTNESRMGGDSSYTELLTCLEMARDVRTMHSDSNASSAPATPAVAHTPATPHTAPVSPAVVPPLAPAPSVTRPSQQ